MSGEQGTHRSTGGGGGARVSGEGTVSQPSECSHWKLTGGRITRRAGKEQASVIR